MMSLLAASLVGATALAAAQTPDANMRIEQLEQRVAAQGRLLSDWGGLIRYGSENTEVPPPKPGENRVVFLGDEITGMWGQGLAPFFPGKPYFNRGIRGQTTGQMLVRFRQDVISLKPKVVVIQAGTNDLAGLSGPATLPMIAENLMSIVELAKANGIRVVLASIPPVSDGAVRQTLIRPTGKIIGMNEWIKEYAEATGSDYLDFFSALVDGRALKKEYTSDGFLLNDAAYRVMAPLAMQAIASALARK